MKSQCPSDSLLELHLLSYVATLYLYYYVTTEYRHCKSQAVIKIVNLINYFYRGVTCCRSFHKHSLSAAEY